MSDIDRALDTFYEVRRDAAAALAIYPDIDIADKDRAANEMVQIANRGVPRTSPIWVEPHIRRYWRHAAETMPENDTYRLDTLPMPHGMIVFDVALPFGDDNYTVLTWNLVDSPSGSGTVFAGWKRFETGYAAIWVLRINEGQAWDECESETQVIPVRKLLATICAFFWQRLVRRVPQDASRAWRRRDHPGWDGRTRVDVVMLRVIHRQGSGDDSGRHIDFKNSFGVRGHWRQQFYPSDNSHRSKWIAPFIKGKGPLKLTTDVFLVKR